MVTSEASRTPVWRDAYVSLAKTAGLTADEMLLPDGSLQPLWAPVIQHFESLGKGDIRELRQAALRLIHENGITYNVHGDPRGTQRPWELDPVPFVISADDWERIESGLIQRAKLLNLVLDDLYGARSLINEGLLPPELIYSHSEFLRPCAGVDASRELILGSADMARGPDGRIWIVNDRTQAPSGSGYALENRGISTRLFPGLFGRCKVRRLAPFFRSLIKTLNGLSPSKTNDPRIVILTPGPLAETYFEHAYLAAYLGVTLVQGDDLTVRDRRVWLRSLAGLEPVDVIVRRLDSTFCDPLTLRSDSYLGVPGLLEAVRANNVALANPLGSGVLENPGLLAFLPRIAQHFLGESLLLPSSATWWCGQKTECQYVLENLKNLVIKSIDRSPDFGTIFADRLSTAELQALRDKIKASPDTFVGQERVTFSTLPCLIKEELQPRHAIFRGTFAAIGKGEFAVMPGGLTRAASELGNLDVTARAGGVAKDTWVLGDAPEPFASLWSEEGDRHQLAPDERNLPSRSGENLFWAGRYAERTEGTARVLRRTLQNYFDGISRNDDVQDQQLDILITALHSITETLPLSKSAEPGTNLPANYPEDELLSMLMDRQRIGTLSATLRRFINACYGVRDLWSLDSWRVIDSIDTQWKSLQKSKAVFLFSFPNELNSLITQLMALTGLNLESMTRQAGWLMLDTGRRLERSLLLISLLRSMLLERRGESHDYLTMENFLAASDSLVTHQRRYRSQPNAESVLSLMLLDENNPRSLLYQVARIQNHAALFPGKKSTGPLLAEDKLLLRANTQLKLCDVRELAQVDPVSGRREHLEKLLKNLATLLVGVSEGMTLTYFSHVKSTSLLG